MAVRGETGARKDDRCLGSPAGTAAVVRERKDQLEADGEGVCAQERRRNRERRPVSQQGEAVREGEMEDGRPAGDREAEHGRPQMRCSNGKFPPI
jgi:hypothetical protein